MQNYRHLVLPLLYFLFLPNLAVLGQQAGDSIRFSGKIIEKGIAHYDKEEYEQALQEFDRVYLADTNYHLAVYEKVLTLQAMKKYDEAKKILLSALNSGLKNKFELLRLAGNIWDLSGSVDSAHRFYDEGIRLFPIHNRMHYEKGVAYKNGGKFKEALKELELSLRLNSFHPATHHAIAHLAFQSDQPALAMLAMQMFSLLNSNPQAQLVAYQFLDGVAEDKLDLDNPAPEDLFTPTEELSEINLLVKSKLALSSKFKAKTRIKESYIKQLQIILENLKVIPSPEEHFILNYYATFYQEVWKKDLFEACIMSGIGSLKEYEAIGKALKKTKSEINEFTAWANSYLADKRAVKNMAFGEVPANAYYIYMNNGNPSGYGTSVKNDKTTGDWIYFNQWGTKSAEGRHDDNGNKTGEWIYYYWNGNISRKENYTAPESYSYTSYFENGALKDEVSIVNKKVEGTLKVYHPTGALRREMEFKNEKLNGPFREYNEQGVLILEKNVINGLDEGKYITYHPNGRKNLETSMLDDKADGEVKKYHLNGRISESYKIIKGNSEGKFESFYEDGTPQKTATLKGGSYHGLVENFYRSGQKSSEQNFQNGKLHGTTKWFDNDGIQYAEIVFANDQVENYKFLDKAGNVLHQAQKQGKTIVWSEYDPFGNLSERVTIENGKNQGEYQYYYTDGTLSYSVPYVDGDRHGVSKRYLRNGKLYEEIHFAKNIKEGYAVTYYSNGKKNLEGYYLNDEKAGLWKSYFRNGSIKSEDWYNEGEIEQFNIDYYADGTTDIAGYYNRGLREKAFLYSPSGACYDTVMTCPGIIKTQFHHAGGYVLREGTYKYGKRDGVWKYYSGPGRLLGEEVYSNGLQQRLETGYHRITGKKTLEAYYSDGERDSTWKYFDSDGRLSNITRYKLGKEHGPETQYYQDGKVDYELTNEDDEVNGPARFFSPDGELMIEYIYRNGTLVAFAYKGQDGKMQPQIPVEKETGKIKAFFRNGTVSIEYTLDRGWKQGKFVNYYSNGKTYCLYNFTDNLYDGVQKEFYPNGQLKRERNFTEGYLHGKLTHYYEDGKVKQIEHYLHGDLHGDVIMYDKTGKVIRTLKFQYDEEIPG